MALARPLWADTPDERLERAKALFRDGNALLAAGDPERALDRFLQSREAVASGKNTANAAICLERLGRYDEALEMYEELLARFSKDLDAQDRENLVPIMSSLRARLGSLDISANVEGLVTVDGKPRGRLPRATALRVVAGERRVRVVQEGYQSFDTTVRVEAGQTVPVDATLEPLRGLGALRVEQTGRAATYLLVDGKSVGLLPWEGTLAVGPHLLQAQGADEGSRPETVRVIERRTLLVRLTVQALGPPLRLQATPPTALLLLDGSELGRGAWAGRLPVGSHTLNASEAGYFPRSQQFSVESGAAPVPISLLLQRDPNHARWPKSNPWTFAVRALGAFNYMPSLRGDHEAACPGLCTGSSAALGGKFEAGFEALHRRGLGLELGVGYQFARQEFTRALLSEFDSIDSSGMSYSTDITYALQQELALGGFYMRVGGVSRLPLPWDLQLRSALGLGFAANSYDASAVGVAWTTGDFADAAGFDYQPISEVMPFVAAGLSVARQLGPVEVAMGVSSWLVPTHGPSFTDAKLGVVPDCNNQMPPPAGCAPVSTVLAGERVHGPFLSLSPELSAMYRF